VIKAWDEWGYPEYMSEQEERWHEISQDIQKAQEDDKTARLARQLRRALEQYDANKKTED